MAGSLKFVSRRHTFVSGTFWLLLCSWVVPFPVAGSIPTEVIADCQGTTQRNLGACQRTVTINLSPPVGVEDGFSCVPKIPFLTGRIASFLEILGLALNVLDKDETTKKQ